MKSTLKNLRVTSLKTEIYERPVNDENSLHPLLNFLIQSLDNNRVGLENSVLAVTSKIVSLAEGVVVKRDQDKNALIRKEADHYLGQGAHGVELTVKHGLLIPSAGIDESNSKDGDYILFPRDPFASAEALWRGLRNHYKLKQFGLILTDSHSTPLRLGVTGIALSYWGFEGVMSKVDDPDLYGRKLKFTHINVVDALATAAVLMMGEGGEGTPLALINIDGVSFSESTDPSEVSVSLENDVYFPILKNSLK